MPRRHGVPAACAACLSREASWAVARSQKRNTELNAQAIRKGERTLEAIQAIQDRCCRPLPAVNGIKPTGGTHQRPPLQHGDRCSRADPLLSRNLRTSTQSCSPGGMSATI